MKKLLTTIAFGVMTATGISALAQTQGPAYGPGLEQGASPAFQQGQGYGPGRGMQGRRGDPAQRIQRRLDRMSRYLELNDRQKAQVKAILEEQHAKRMSMRTEMHNRIAAVLDEEQRAKFEQMKAQRGKGRPGGGQGYGPGPGIGMAR